MSMTKIAHCTAPKGDHRLYLLPAGKALPATLPLHEHWQRILERKHVKAAELAKSPLVADLPDGTRAALVMADAGQARFERLTVLRKAVMLLLDESPRQLCIVSLGADPTVDEDAVYVALVNGAALPQQKKKPPKPLEKLWVCRPGHSGRADRRASADFSGVTALAQANLLARELTALPPNRLDPVQYRKRLRALAREKRFSITEYDFRKLQKLGAGAFCAVAQGSDADGGGAAIVHLSWQPKRKIAKRIALVGKGICFDTGGHNLKPGTFMTSMHTDMGGSAVALALLVAAAELDLPVRIDCWLAIAKNHVSPTAYVPGDIVTALNGTTIEVVHTDAEGRMVLADALVLATRATQDTKPDLVMDFATLTGSMKTALGRRYAGVFASDDELAALAVAAGRSSGERVCVFPQDADYDAALDSSVADVKQCTLEGGADHILATRFLSRFVGDTRWLHMDLSPTNCAGGLGAVATDLTGFGVSWGLALLRSWAETP